MDFIQHFAPKVHPPSQKLSLPNLNLEIFRIWALFGFLNLSRKLPIVLHSLLKEYYLLDNGQCYCAASCETPVTYILKISRKQVHVI